MTKGECAHIRRRQWWWWLQVVKASCISLPFPCTLRSHKGGTRYQDDNNQWKSWMVMHMHDQKKVMKVTSHNVSTFFWKEDGDDDDCEL